MPDGKDCTLFHSIAQIIPWALVVGGWWIVNKQNNFRERRKETRAILNQLLDDLDAIEKQAFSYHTAKEALIELGRDIKISLSRISKDVARHDLLPSGKRHPIVKLRQAITLKNFDTDCFQTQNVNCELLDEISATKDDLIDALEQHFQDHYQK